jgi:hypothetical protein
MHMCALNAEMHDPKRFAPCDGERRLPNGLIDASAPQVADRADRPQRHVYGIPLMEKRPRLVR